MTVEPKTLPDNIERQARAVVESLRSGAGWLKEHGRIQRMVIIRDDEPELESSRLVYERAVEILQEQGYAARFHSQPHDAESGSRYVQMAICIGR